MITSPKEYNELYYAINDPNNSNIVTDPYLFTEEILVQVMEVAEFVSKDLGFYPLLKEGHLYYLDPKGEKMYEGNYDLESLKTKFPNTERIPIFYERRKEGRQYYVALPYDEPIYKIDLNTRTIETPKFLSVLEDHNSEIIWFKVDRFYDDFDLYGCTCLIQYKNALKEQHVCVVVPKVIKESNHDVLYIPWPISGAATKAAGKIEFAFQFYKLSGDGTRVFYSLNTQPATSTILNGMHIDPLNIAPGEEPDDSEYSPEYTELKAMMDNILSQYSNFTKQDIYWLEVK